MWETLRALVTPFRPTLSERVEPAVVKLWRIHAALSYLAGGAVLVGIMAALLAFVARPGLKTWSWSAFVQLSWAWKSGVALVAGLYLLSFVLAVVVFPPLRWARFRYELRDQELEIESGIWTMERVIIPFARVQQVDLSQGPIERLFGLATVEVATAYKTHDIPGLTFAAAEALRRQIVEKAGLTDAF